ncbi:MAG: hypothetical protein Q9M10_06915 [Mariprofundaceae bacterium]|nr:hypothetical protein [Mariprofundaceae bacterium]
MKYNVSIVVCLLLSACSSSTPVWTAPEQAWGKFNVHFETRPEVLHKGMNEFLVFVNRQGKKHIPDLLVKIQINDDRMQQAMPDGALGIYRRALYVHDEKTDRLHVHLGYHGQEGDLFFALSPHDKKTIAP